MGRDLGCFEKAICNALVLLIIPYAATVFIYSVIELEAPCLYILLPVIAICGVTAAIWSAAANQPVWKSIRTGILLGFVAFLSLFSSNFLFNEPFHGKYYVREVSEGRGSLVYWRVDMPDRKNVQLALNVAGVSVNSNPKDVTLSLRRGWLGYYYGNKS